MSQHHFFASTAFNWATAPTREEAIAKVARAAGGDIIKRNVKANGGLYCWTTRVDCPAETHYSIHYYQPHKLLDADDNEIDVRVPLSRAMAFNIQNVKGHVTYIEEKS